MRRLVSVVVLVTVAAGVRVVERRRERGLEHDLDLGARAALLAPHRDVVAEAESIVARAARPAPEVWS